MVIYKPSGRALEYSDLAVNLFKGCAHGCHYCFAPGALRLKRVQFHAETGPRTDILKKLEKEAPSHAGKEVFMCFSCDPYGPDSDNTTRKAIQILHEAGVAVNILSKGGLRVLRDMDLFRAQPDLTRIGATLTFDNLKDSLAWEPHAATPFSRIDMLKRAHENGIRTWVSLEPVIIPEQSLNLIWMTHPYVDHYKVGRWNHDSRANEIDWRVFLNDVTDVLSQLKKDYYIKKDLALFSDKGME